MNQKTGVILTTIAVVFCGLPGMLACLGGSFIADFGLLADKAQLKLDTNLDKVSVIWNGLGGICLSVILIAIPITIWLWIKRH